jgi:TolA-binding protein
MGWFKKVKVWWKRHVIPGLNGRVEELEKQVKEMVANQKQSDARITELETQLRDQIIKTERLEVMLRGYLLTLREKMQESDRRREATMRGHKTSLGVKLNKDSEREESEAPLRGQKKIQGSKVKAIKEFMENMQGAYTGVKQGAYTGVKQVGNGWKIAGQIKRLGGRMRRQSSTESSK